MKKVVLLLFVVLLTTTVSAQFKVGGGVTIGPEIGLDDDYSEKMGFGINVRGEFSLMDKLALTPGFTYFFPSAPDGIDYSIWQLNADVHYTLAGAGTPVSVYLLGGLNYTSVKFESEAVNSFEDALDEYEEYFGDAMDITIDGGDDDPDNEIGINGGAGVSFSKFYGEVKYDTALEQIGLSVGIMF